MIRRDSQNGWLLVSQLEHARLAHDLAAAWGNGLTPSLPLGEWLLPAIRDHDEGWLKWELAPDLNEEGSPRSFMEMPAEDSVAIWSRSINHCAEGAASFSQAMRRLRGDGQEITTEQAAALDQLLDGSRRFRREDFLVELGQRLELNEELASSAFDRFEGQGLIHSRGTVLGADYYKVSLPPAGEAPLGGLWVSEHFQTLARQAMEHRADDADEVDIFGRFLNEQYNRCEIWRTTATEFAGAELDRVIDSGLRYLQLFDRISLWLCMAERDQPWEARLGQGRTFVFRPQTQRIIQVAPWPFGEVALEVSVRAWDGERAVILPWRLVPGE